jgi:hypothetical protein
VCVLVVVHLAPNKAVISEEFEKKHMSSVASHIGALEDIQGPWTNWLTKSITLCSELQAWDLLFCCLLQQVAIKTSELVPEVGYEAALDYHSRLLYQVLVGLRCNAGVHTPDGSWDLDDSICSDQQDASKDKTTRDDASSSSGSKEQQEDASIQSFIANMIAADQADSASIGDTSQAARVYGHTLSASRLPADLMAMPELHNLARKLLTTTPAGWCYSPR